MRFNTKKYQELMTEQELTPESICRTTGLGERSFQWIMTNGFASEDAMERLAEVTGTPVGELLLPDISWKGSPALSCNQDSPPESLRLLHLPLH